MSVTTLAASDTTRQHILCPESIALTRALEKVLQNFSYVKLHTPLGIIRAQQLIQLELASEGIVLAKELQHG